MVTTIPLFRVNSVWEEERGEKPGAWVGLKEVRMERSDQVRTDARKGLDLQQ